MHFCLNFSSPESLVKPIILGSQSPRRKEILSFFNLPFKQIPSNFDESSVPFRGIPEEYVSELSRNKALELHKEHPQETILTADTIVYKDGRVFGKPETIEEAIETLGVLQNEWHSVYTALHLKQGHQSFDKVEETRVLFNPLTPKEIEIYLRQQQWADKAGGYAIQMGGGLIVRKIDGCYFNVMGLPINALRNIFTHIGIDLWERIKQ